MINNERTRQEKVDVTEYLTRIGLLDTLDAFLAQQRVQDVEHKAFEDKVAKLKALPDVAPETIKTKLLELIDTFAESEETIKRNIFGSFKQDIGSILYALEEYIPLDATVQTFKDNLENETGLIDKLEEATAEELDSLEKSFKVWMLPRCMEVAESGEDVEELLKAFFGDDMPDNILGIGIMIGGPDFDGDDDDDDDDDESGEHECCCGGNCGCDHREGHECKCQNDGEGGGCCNHEE